MKKILIPLVLSLSLLTQLNGQVTRILGDTIKIYQNGNNKFAELLLQNSTANRTNGFLQNFGNGKTRFAFVLDSVYFQNRMLYFRRGLANVSFPILTPADTTDLIATKHDISNGLPSLDTLADRIAAGHPFVVWQTRDTTGKAMDSLAIKGYPETYPDYQLYTKIDGTDSLYPINSQILHDADLRNGSGINKNNKRNYNGFRMEWDSARSFKFYPKIGQYGDSAFFVGSAGKHIMRHGDGSIALSAGSGGISISQNSVIANSGFGLRLGQFSTFGDQASIQSSGLFDGINSMISVSGDSAVIDALKFIIRSLPLTSDTTLYKPIGYNTATGRLARFPNFIGGGGMLNPLSVGSSPNVYGFSYDNGSGDFRLQPASAGSPGVVTNSSQTFSGIKNFQADQTIFEAVSDNESTIRVNRPGGNALLQIGSYPGNRPTMAMWAGNITPGSANYMLHASDAFIRFQASSLIQLRASGVDRLALNGTGVGVNTTDPTASLDVNGNMRLRTVGSAAVRDSALYIEDGMIVAGPPVSGGGGTVDSTIFATRDRVKAMDDSITKARNIPASFTSSTSITVDFITRARFIGTLSHNTTFTVSNMHAGEVVLYIINGSGGPYSVTLPGSFQPILKPNIGDITMVVGAWNGTNWFWGSDAGPVIGDGTITYAKIQNVSATNRLMGRISSGSGILEELTGTQATSLLDVFTTSVKGLVPAATGGNTTVQFLRKDGTWATPSSSNQTITITAGTDLSGSASGTTSISLPLTINSQAVTYSKIQNVSATNRLMGRISSGSGILEELTGTQATSLLDVFTTSVKGLVPAATGGNTTVQFLRKDGTWATPSSSNQTISFTASGDLSGSSSGTTALTPTLVINNQAVTYAKMQNVSTSRRFLGRGIGKGEGIVEEITPEEATNMINPFDRSSAGTVPPPGGSGAVRFLREDGTWAEPPSSGSGTTAAGTYIPTLTGISNFSTIGLVHTPYIGYTRVNDIVTVIGSWTVGSTTTGTSSFRMSLPIASDLTPAEETNNVWLGGMVGLVNGSVGEISPDTSNDEVIITYTATGTSGKVSFTFSYKIR